MMIKLLGVFGVVLLTFVVWKAVKYRKLIAIAWDFMPFRRLDPQLREEVNEMFR